MYSILFLCIVFFPQSFAILYSRKQNEKKIHAAHLVQFECVSLFIVLRMPYELYTISTAPKFRPLNTI